MRRSRIVILLLWSLLAAGCGEGTLEGPPELRLGRDECAECGMLVSEDRFSSAVLVERDGRREHVHFDDIGCMLDYEHELEQGVRVVRGFVHDHETRAWVTASEAFFVFAEPERLRTPMGSGIAAFAESAAADLARQRWGGEGLDYQGLGRARRDWMRARYGEPPSSP